MYDNTSSIDISKNPYYALKNKAYSNQVSFPKGIGYITNYQIGIHGFQGTDCKYIYQIIFQRYIWVSQTKVGSDTYLIQKLSTLGEVQDQGEQRDPVKYRKVKKNGEASLCHWFQKGREREKKNGENERKKRAIRK